MSRYLATKRTSNILSSAIGFTINKSKIPGLKDFLLKVHPSQSPTNALLTEFWETTFGCQFFPEAENVKLCTGYENLKEINNTFTDVSELRISNNVYKAVYAIAYALHNTLACQTDGYLDNVLCSQKDILLPGERPRSMCSESCQPGYRQAQIKGRPPCCFECVQCPVGEITNMTGNLYSIECIRCPLEYWSNENHSLCVPKKVEFLSFDEDMGVILTVFSLTGVSFTVAVGMVFFYFIDTPLVKASNTELSFLLLFSLTLCFLCSLTFIGQPSKWSCMLRHTAFGITFALCMSCVLARTIAVVMAFKATVPANSPPQCSVTKANCRNKKLIIIF
uniref:Olfactory receptor C family, h1 n=1 Tax=Electrophorus electricus TaxID=8005 RepID=A0A4W4G0L7_ELEEL